MKKLFAIIAVSMLCLGGCTNESKTVEALENAGYTKIQTKGYSLFGCGENDGMYHTKFEATNPNGKRVKGTVCCGMMTGCVIRF